MDLLAIFPTPKVKRRNKSVQNSTVLIPSVVVCLSGRISFCRTFHISARLFFFFKFKKKILGEYYITLEFTSILVFFRFVSHIIVECHYCIKDADVSLIHSSFCLFLTWWCSTDCATDWIVFRALKVFGASSILFVSVFFSLNWNGQCILIGTK